MNNQTTQQPRVFAVIDGVMVPTSRAVLQHYRNAYGDDYSVRFIDLDAEPQQPVDNL